MDKRAKIIGMQGIVFIFLIILLILDFVILIGQETVMHLGFGYVIGFVFYALKVARS